MRRPRVKRALDAMANAVQARSRRKKWDLYARAFPPRVGESVLDIGASSLIDLPGENYFLHAYPYPDQVTAVGIDDLGTLQRRHPEMTFVQADGRDLPFPDQSFDVVHANAVIEHVGPRTQQAQFVGELARVGRAGIVTTPNRWFPIETHCRLPLIHWLPQSIVHRLGNRLRVADLTWWLLGARGFRRLFPDSTAVDIETTRVLGWPLTIVAVFRSRAAPSDDESSSGS